MGVMRRGRRFACAHNNASTSGRREGSQRLIVWSDKHNSRAKRCYTYNWELFLLGRESDRHWKSDVETFIAKSLPDSQLCASES